MNLIVAVDNQWGIGKDNHLLCHLPKDLEYFKSLTDGKVVVMGRKTQLSLPHKFLNNRTNIVLTTDTEYKSPFCLVVNNEEELFRQLKMFNSDEVFIIGGASIYNNFYKYCDTLYVTKINADLNADTFITNFDNCEDFELVEKSDIIEENGIEYQFCKYKKVGS